MIRQLFILSFTGILLLTSCATQEQAADKKTLTTTDSATVAVAPSKPGPLSSTLNAYYELKDAFVRTDGTGADMKAMQFRLSADSLDATKLEIDSSYTTAITGYKKTMLASVDSLIKERDMQQKRKNFETISNALYSLAKAIPYRGETVYQVYCPMAFDRGANWLNNQPVVANPYFGSKMMDCGEVTDSLMGSR